MAGQFIGVNGVARKVKNQFMGVNGVARKVKNGFIGVGNVARKFFSGETVKVTIQGILYFSPVVTDDTGKYGHEYGYMISNMVQVKAWVSAQVDLRNYFRAGDVVTLSFPPDSRFEHLNGSYTIETVYDDALTFSGVTFDSQSTSRDGEMIITRNP